MILKGSRKELEEKAAWIISEAVQTLLDTQSHVVFGIVGGSSVGKVFSNLRAQTVDWRRVHLFMVDERLVSLDHPDSNFGLAISHFEDLFPPENLHPFLYSPDTADQGITAYESELKKYGGRFDIVLVSSGEDGHIAAIFPEHASIYSDEATFLTMDNSPKPPPGRMSSSRALIENSKVGLLLFLGHSKETALTNFLSERKSLEECPAKIIRNIPEHYILTDLEIMQ